MEQHEWKQNPSELSSLSEIQTYLHYRFIERGFSGQTASDKILLLAEEVGELAKAIRLADYNGPIDYEKLDHYGSVKEESADVFIVLISICDYFGFNLIDALIKKEEINLNRRWR